MSAWEPNVKVLKVFLALTVFAAILFYASALKGESILNYRASLSLALYCSIWTLLAAVIAYLVARKLDYFANCALVVFGYLLAGYPAFAYFFGKGLDMALLPVPLLLPVGGLGIAIGALLRAVNSKQKQ